MTALLTDDEVRKIGLEYVESGVNDFADTVSFRAGARFARDRYEAREKLWRELARLGSISDGCLYRSIELRLALGIDKEGA